METRLRNEDEKLSTEPGQLQGLMPSRQSLICSISSASATGVAQLCAGQACLCRGFISVAYRWPTALVTPHTSLCSPNSSQAGCVELSDPNRNFVAVMPFRPAALR